MTFQPLGIQASDIAALIAADTAAKPRTLQRAPGPSTLGHPCPRHVAYHHVGADKVTLGGDPLPSWIGTEAHAGMERILAGHPDWDTEIGVELPGYGIRGTADAYHRPSRTVIDWKFVGASSLKQYRDRGPGPQYRAQAHLYGLGLSMAGYDVEHVAIVFVPRSGLTSGIHVWTERWDGQVCEDTLRRYEAVATVADALGATAVPTGPGKCDWCPFHDPSGVAGCAGHKEGDANVR